MAIQVRDFKRIFHKVGDHEVLFEASNQDTRGSQFQYFGYISSEGSWIIQRFNIQESGNTFIYGYFAGQTRSVYDANWNATGHYTGSLTFVTFDQITTSLE